MELYLIRHGESHVNTGKPLPRKELDAGLTDLGRRQAQALAGWLPDFLPEVDLLFTSTMRRALETAEYIEPLYDLQAVPEDRLREIGNNFLDATPLPSGGLPNKWSDTSPYHFPFSPITQQYAKIETPLHFRARVGLFVDEILQKHAGKTVIAVAHGGVLNALADIIFNVGVYRRCDIHVPNTAVSHFEFRGPTERETWRVYSIGRTDHLRGIG